MFFRNSISTILSEALLPSGSRSLLRGSISLTAPNASFVVLSSTI